MYRFADLYGKELEKHLLGKVGNFYLALACVLIGLLCETDKSDFKFRYL